MGVSLLVSVLLTTSGHSLHDADPRFLLLHRPYMVVLDLFRRES
jgi:hypothetical protein